jgi:HEAT repeat protein
VERGEDRGEDSVELAGERVSLDVSDAGQLRVLQQLAEQGGFDLELHEITPRAVTLRLEDATLSQAVAAIVGPSAFRIDYAFDPPRKRHAVVALHVGGTSSLRPAAASVTESAPKSGMHAAIERQGVDSSTEIGQAPPRERSRRDQIDDARERLAPLRDEMRRTKGKDLLALESEYERAQGAFQEQLRLALQDPDPNVRTEALEEVDVSQGDARQRIGSLAREDPDPRIQMAAIETLAEDGTFQAVSELVTMLEASNPDVLVATLDALDLSGDESLAPRVEPLASHSDAAVREKAREMLEYWE